MMTQAFDQVAESAGHAVPILTPFGDFEAEPSAFVDFPEGLPGFEECRRFVVLASRGLDPFQCLHAVDGPPASFLAIDPRLALPGYRCRLSARDAGRLQAQDAGRPQAHDTGQPQADDAGRPQARHYSAAGVPPAGASSLLWLALLAVDGDRVTANLRAPVVINPALMIGYQVMPANTLYPLKHPVDLG